MLAGVDSVVSSSDPRLIQTVNNWGVGTSEVPGSEIAGERDRKLTLLDMF